MLQIGATDASNNAKLIKNLQGIENRKAHFVSVITLGKPDGRAYSFRGEVEGEIIDIPRGDTGFGYDPHFYVAEYGKTLAEMPEMKNVISHRANALKKLEVIDIPRGDTGFGYDPHFYVAEYGKTLAEMPEMKNVISHRANALKKLEVELEEILKD